LKVNRNPTLQIKSSESIALASQTRYNETRTETGNRSTKPAQPSAKVHRQQLNNSVSHMATSEGSQKSNLRRCAAFEPIRFEGHADVVAAGSNEPKTLVRRIK
jgi:hypothetical protein